MSTETKRIANLCKGPWGLNRSNWQGFREVEFSGLFTNIYVCGQLRLSTDKG